MALSRERGTAGATQPAAVVARTARLVGNSFLSPTLLSLLLQLPGLVALFDGEVVEFDIVPIMLRLLKDPFSSGMQHFQIK